MSQITLLKRKAATDLTTSLSMLSSEIDRIDTAIGHLIARLEFVLIPSHDAPPEHEATECEGSPLSQIIVAEADRCGLLATKLMRLGRQIDLNHKEQ